MKLKLTLVLLVLITIILSGCGILKGDSKNTSPNPDTSAAPSASNGSEGSIAASSTAFKIDIPEKSSVRSLEIPGTAGKDQVVYINGKKVSTDNNGNFKAKVDLVAGMNPISIKVLSSKGDSVYETGRNVEYIPGPETPLLQIKPNPFPTELDSNSEGIDSDRLIVSGITDPGSMIEANGSHAAANEKGEFIIAVPLHNGDNIINIMSTNRSGAKSTFQKILKYTKKPLLNVPLPDNLNVSTKTITVNGFTDPNSVLEIYNNCQDGDKKTTSLVFKGNISDGRFIVDVTLANGANNLLIRASNQYGESTEESRVIMFKDLQLPQIENILVTPQRPQKNKAVKIQANITYDNYGIAKVSAEYISPVSNRTEVVELKHNALLNLWEGSLSNTNEPGLWKFYDLRIQDEAGNWQRLFGKDLSNESRADFTVE